MYSIGIDLGGTNIAAGLVDASMRIVDRESVKTNAPRPVSALIGDMALLAEVLMARSGLTRKDILCLGVGVPCTADQRNGHLEDANNLGFDDEPFLPLLGERAGLPVRFCNDANAAAWGEYMAGGHPGNSLVMVTLGTGIGGGIVLGGRLWEGDNGAAGEFGHMTLRPGGPLCTCGRRGCFEACCSATALIREARAAMERDPHTTLWTLSGGDRAAVEAKLVFDGAAAGDGTCARLLDEYTTLLAEGFANIINALQPTCLCIGGGVSGAGERLLSPLREKTAGLIYSKNAKRNTRLELASLGGDAGIVGAALLGYER